MKKIILVCLIVFIAWYITTEPSNTRDWSPDQATLPSADISGNSITVHNIRNFTYKSTSDYTANYYDKTFDLDKIATVDYIVEPFEGIGAAHTFLSFGFEDGSFVAISVEIRKEKGETFSVWKGVLKRYELMYVVADERDVIKLRSNYRKDPVYIYEVKTSKAKVQALFVNMIEGINGLKEKPKFYNTLTNNCTIIIADHVNNITPGKIPWWNPSLIFPKNSDVLALKLGLIEAPDGIEKAREKYKVNDLAEKYADAPDFSQKIRSGR